MSDICEDVVLLQDKKGDPFRAYHLRRDEFLWERNLLAEMKARYGAQDVVPLPLVKSSGPGTFVCRYGKGLYGFTLEDGHLHWGFNIVTRAIKAHRRRLYVWGGTAIPSADRFVCLDAASGALIYEVPVETHGMTPGTVSDRHIAYAERSGFLAVFRLSDGALVWSYKHKHDSEVRYLGATVFSLAPRMEPSSSSKATSNPDTSG